MKNIPNYLCRSATKSQNITVDFGTVFSMTAAFQVHSRSRASSYDWSSSFPPSFTSRLCFGCRSTFCPFGVTCVSANPWFAVFFIFPFSGTLRIRGWLPSASLPVNFTETAGRLMKRIVSRVSCFRFVADISRPPFLILAYQFADRYLAEEGYQILGCPNCLSKAM